MKKQLLALLMLAVLSAVAFAGPSITPFIEIENVGIVAQPTLELGATVEGMLSPSWFIDLGFTYGDTNLLNRNNSVSLDFESNIGFDELATVNTTGSLVYGCLLSLTCDVTYETNYPNATKLIGLEPGFKAMGYVGPLSLWAGLSLPWATPNWLDFIPSFGFRVSGIIDLYTLVGAHHVCLLAQSRGSTSCPALQLVLGGAK